MKRTWKDGEFIFRGVLKYTAKEMSQIQKVVNELVKLPIEKSKRKYQTDYTFIKSLFMKYINVSEFWRSYISIGVRERFDHLNIPINLGYIPSNWDRIIYDDLRSHLFLYNKECPNSPIDRWRHKFPKNRISNEFSYMQGEYNRFVRGQFDPTVQPRDYPNNMCTKKYTVDCKRKTERDQGRTNVEQPLHAILYNYLLQDQFSRRLITKEQYQFFGISGIEVQDGQLLSIDGNKIEILCDEDNNITTINKNHTNFEKFEKFDIFEGEELVWSLRQ